MNLLAPPDCVVPSDVNASLELLGEHLREARLRRNLTVEQVAQAVGVTRKTIAEAEKGNPATRAGVYVGIFCALDIADQLVDLATAARDVEELGGDDGRKRARPTTYGRRT